MIKIYFIGCVNSATAFYRGFLPLRLLPGIRVFHNNGVTKGALRFSGVNTLSRKEVLDSDMIFSSRAADRQTTDFLLQAKAHGKKIIVDYDDDFFNVEKNDPYYDVLTSLRQSVIDQLVVADLITVSTDHLRTTFIEAIKSALGNACDARFESKIHVVRNTLIPGMQSFPDLTESHFEKRLKEEKPHFLWRGNPTHKFSFDMMRNFDGIRFTCLGMNSGLTGSNIRNIGWLDLIQYMKFIKSSDVLYFLKPLHDINGNDCKSDISALEGLTAGALTLASPKKEFIGKPWIINVADDDWDLSALAGKVKELGPKEMLTAYDIGVSFYRDELSFQKMQGLRLALIEKLMES
ncbi:MAG: hypothetical protein QM741_17850 [Rudaea sp.]|uniref:hypothetical protein n=1 Tax=Rudaea sp. TaxID=2136325 RepID=UPI0039E373D0